MHCPDEGDSGMQRFQYCYAACEMALCAKLSYVEYRAVPEYRECVCCGDA